MEVTNFCPFFSIDDHCLFSLFPPFFLSFLLYIFLGTKGCTRNVFYFTFPRTKTSFSLKFSPQLLSDFVQEFREKALLILADSARRSEMVETAAEYVALHHSLKQEESAYLNIVKSCLADDTAKPASLTNGCCW